MTNPLYNYQKLATQFSSITIVLEPGPQHVMLRHILELFSSYRLISSSVQADFFALLGCETTATSGMGTFPIAAALLSQSLRHLYFSWVFILEDLNPDMIDRRRTEVHALRLRGFPRAWRNSHDRRALLHRYRTDECFPKC